MSGLRDLADDGTAALPPIADPLHGRAVIERVTRTRVTSDGNPEVELALTVELPGRDPYPALWRRLVSRRVLHHLQPGGTVAVTVDAGDPQRVELG